MLTLTDNFIFAASSLADINDRNGVVLRKFDYEGNLYWEKGAKNTAYTEIQLCAEQTSTGYLFCNSKNSSSDYSLIRIDPENGDLRRLQPLPQEKWSPDLEFSTSLSSPHQTNCWWDLGSRRSSC